MTEETFNELFKKCESLSYNYPLDLQDIRELKQLHDKEIQKLQKDKVKLLQDIEHIIYSEQFFGTRNYTEGCIKGIESLRKFIEENKKSD